MPVLVVYGFPKGYESRAETLIPKLQNAVAGVWQLGLSPNQVSVFFPVDIVQKGLGEELIVVVEGLLAQPERTELVRQEVAEKITEVLTEFAKSQLEKCQLVETFVNSQIKTGSGFSRWKKGADPKPPTVVTPEMEKKWAEEAKESVRKAKEQGLVRRDLPPGMPGAQGWCKACDNDEEHTHTIHLK